MAVTRKILDDTFSKMMKDTVSEVIEKSIKEMNDAIEELRLSYQAEFVEIDGKL